MKNFLICLLYFSVSFWLGNTAMDEDPKYFEQFKLVYKKSYESDEEEYRRERILLRNFAFIEEHNLNYTKGLVHYELGVNEFADIDVEEFGSTMSGSDEKLDIKSVIQQGATFIPPANVELPEAVDWRELGAVTDVKRQKRCGSCYAFAATGALEGQHFRKTGELISLSAQNLIDCTMPYGNKGCTGGNKERSYLYVRDNGGINSADTYPYRAAVDSECLFDPFAIAATSKGFVNIPQNDEYALMAAVATVGPISVKLNMKCLQTQLYRHGILDSADCVDHRKPNHGLLLVGYGHDNITNIDYWILKNSWGVSWGMDGYVQVPRNVNYGGIARRPSYPLV